MTKERLLKIYELARRGVDGERENAERMLTRGLSRLGITLDELLGEPAALYWFAFRTGYERRLLLQIVATLRNNPAVEHWKRKRALGFELTPAQFGEVSVQYDVFRRAWRQEIEDAFSAFITANRVLPSSSSDEPLTPEELEQLRRVARRVEAIDPTPVHRQIEAST